jgi:hypothetical protein
MILRFDRPIQQSFIPIEEIATSIHTTLGLVTRYLGLAQITEEELDLVMRSESYPMSTFLRFLTHACISSDDLSFGPFFM